MALIIAINAWKGAGGTDQAMYLWPHLQNLADSAKRPLYPVLVRIVRLEFNDMSRAGQDLNYRKLHTRIRGLFRFANGGSKLRRAATAPIQQVCH